MAHRTAQSLRDLLRTNPVVEFHDILAALDGASSSTAFRYLQQVPYRTSYNHNGRYYTMYEPARYDQFGLFRHGDIFFSRDGTLKPTVRRLIQESEAGFTQRELQDLLRVRVQHFLQTLFNAGEVQRERLEGIYHYLHADAEIGQAQLRCRIAYIAAAKESKIVIDDTTVIRVLLVLIRHPGASSEQIVRHLRGYSPPIVLNQVSAVFTRYSVEEKGGPTIF
jgi:hypothetical protein